MTLRRLRIFAEVAESGKIIDTAKKFYVSQASVSQSIAELEKEAGFKLFERLNKRLYLTPEGRQLLTLARQMLNYEKVLEDFIAQSSGTKVLRVGASLSVGASVLSDLIRQMKLRHADVQCYVTVARNHKIEGSLLSNELDLALGDRTPVAANLICTPFLRDDLVLVCNRQHPFWGRTSVRLTDLANQNLVVRDAAGAGDTKLEKLLIEKDIPYQVTWRCADILASIKAVRSGLGVTTVSRRLVVEDIQEGFLWPVEILDADLTRTFNILYHKDKFVTDPMRSFIRLAENCEDEMHL